MLRSLYKEFQRQMEQLAQWISDGSLDVWAPTPILHMQEDNFSMNYISI